MASGLFTSSAGSVAPSQTIASGHVAAVEGSEGSHHDPIPSIIPASSHFSFSIPTSEASQSFSNLSAVGLDDLSEHQNGSTAKQESTSIPKATDAQDISGLGPAPLRRNQACLSCRKRK
ncbi:hypothetical protein OC846_002587, partial [Tilletia horrida]